MTELDEAQWDLGGLLLDGEVYVVGDTQGLEDAADSDTATAERSGDGTAVGRTRSVDRDIVLAIGLRSDAFATLAELEEAKDALRAVMAPTDDRRSPRVLRWRHRGVTKRVEYFPAQGRPLDIPGDPDALDLGWVDCTARLWCPDPLIYSDEIFETDVDEATPGFATEIELVNGGTITAVEGARPGSSLGVYQWDIVAGAGGCTWPFVQNVDHPEEFWMLAEDLGPDAHASLSWSRVSRRNVTPRYSQVKGADGSPIVSPWPRLRPGTNTWKVGCFDGSVTGTVWHRSTWS